MMDPLRFFSQQSWKYKKLINLLNSYKFEVHFEKIL